MFTLTISLPMMKVGVPVYLEMSDGIKVEWNVHSVVLMT
jgi:hypothetical protein